MEKNLAEFLASFSTAVELAQQQGSRSSDREPLREVISRHLGMPPTTYLSWLRSSRSTVSPTWT
ncbi:hypothetical protein [Arthrobacter luteolus]|uniref:hypothetical protein n=1 Tax=Arthrobacter luteolus TaxID=98672 RepID=UPI00384DC4F2